MTLIVLVGKKTEGRMELTGNREIKDPPTEIDFSLP